MRTKSSPQQSYTGILSLELSERANNISKSWGMNKIPVLASYKNTAKETHGILPLGNIF